MPGRGSRSSTQTPWPRLAIDHAAARPTTPPPLTAGGILVTGAAGRLGAALVEAFEADDVLAHGRHDLDVTDPVAVRETVAAASPSLVINCAAFNNVDGAEDLPAQALAVNAFAVRS